jgi:hypothetical protein
VTLWTKKIDGNKKYNGEYVKLSTGRKKDHMLGCLEGINNKSPAFGLTVHHSSLSIWQGQTSL